ncbi:unnamed protein product [Rhizophagus irregularis]|uniref:Uncharacterized protein n=1 Tax=Rhizophagus irregularis TaxID=588596 RepID=A0A915Z9J8_9GLOM|nr:unnamed protein product [Rhizophagus irregularis]
MGQLVKDFLRPLSDINVEPRAREGCGIEGEKYEDIPRSEYCRNRTGLDAIPLALGQLLRISPVGSSIKWQSYMMSGVFWPLGDTLEEARTRSWTLWVVDEESRYC